MQYEMMRNVLAAVRKEMIGGWRNLHKVELHDLHTSPNITEVAKVGETSRTCGRYRGTKGPHRKKFDMPT
jgi:hypothetical protein